MNNDQMRLDDAIALLQRTPESLRALLQDLPDTWIKAREGDETWSPYDVLGHLAYSERTNWIPRMNRILEGKMQPFDPFDRNAQFRESNQKSITELLATFSELRHQNVARLKELKLASKDVDRRGVHPDLGEVTLGQLLATWVVHDLDHLAQISRTMAKVYTTATGPWSAYLSILRDREK